MIDRITIDMGANESAWKTSTMRGYLFKTELDAEIYGDGAYTLTFRKAANSGGQPVDYVFYFNVDQDVLTAYNTEHSTSYTATDSATLNLSKNLLGHILNPQWNTGTKDEFEEVRAGQGEW